MTDPMAIPDGVWIDRQLTALHAAQGRGDRGEVGRLLALLEAEGPPGIRIQAQRLLDVLARLDCRDEDLMLIEVDLDALGQQLCDFCADPASCYFPYRAFEFTVGGVLQRFGDGRWWCCSACRPYVEANRWRELRERCGEPARGPVARLLWLAFKANRDGEAVPVDAP